jgi:hypothetical protein
MSLTVCILALGLLVLGAVLMLVCRVLEPTFFKGETLHHDTPAMIVPE